MERRYKLYIHDWKNWIDKIFRILLNTMIMKLCIYILMLLCIPFQMEAQHRPWNKLSQAEQEKYMIQKANDILIEESYVLYGKDILPNLNDITHEFSEVKNDTEQGNSENIPLIRLTFHSSKHEKQNHETYVLFVDFDKKTGRHIRSRFGNGEGLNYKFIGDPLPRTVVNYKGYLRNKDRSRYRDIVNKCIEAIQAFGPDYYQPDGRYQITETVYLQDGIPNSVTRYNGKAYYHIAFMNGLKDKPMKSPFCAEVCMWIDSGEIWSITFGNGEEISFIGYSYETEKQKKNHRVVPLEILPLPE